MIGESTPTPPPAAPPAASAPARIVVRDDLHRSRLTVFFRLLLAIPHFLVLALWSLLAAVLALVSWFAILFTGRAVGVEMQEQFVRYFSHVQAYVYLGANPYPSFGGESDYPVDVEIEGRTHQSRWRTLFRIVLAIPALLLCFAFGSGNLQADDSARSLSIGVLGAAGVLGWFASLAIGRMPRGLRDLVAYCVGYLAQTAAYVLLVTDRYPNSDPLVPDYGDVPADHPVRISATDDLRRSRLTVFFRLPLWFPHLFWLVLWGIVTALAVIGNWLFALVAGRPAQGLHRFISAYLRYWTHVNAFLYLVSNPFPGFVGRAGSYPVDLALPAPERQSRWKTLFRLVLAIPALIVGGAVGSALGLVGVFGWFTGLFVGHMPEGLRNLGVFILRYQAQVAAYLWLLTDRYPFSGPSLEALAPAAMPAAEPTSAPTPA